MIYWDLLGNLNPKPDIRTHQLCDLGQITYSFQSSVSCLYKEAILPLLEYVLRFIGVIIPDQCVYNMVYIKQISAPTIK